MTRGRLEREREYESWLRYIRNFVGPPGRILAESDRSQEAVPRPCTTVAMGKRARCMGDGQSSTLIVVFLRSLCRLETVGRRGCEASWLWEHSDSWKCLVHRGPAPWTQYYVVYSKVLREVYQVRRHVRIQASPSTTRSQAEHAMINERIEIGEYVGSVRGRIAYGSHTGFE